jgi:hypothetical protein
MLKASEKAYCRALQALKQKDYARAADYFSEAAPDFTNNQEFVLLWETTRLLVAVKEELRTADEKDKLEIEEVFSYGKKDELR